MLFSPKPYQAQGIDHLRNNPRAALFAGMGLGKTAMVLSAYTEHLLSGESVGALVVAPLRVCVLTWPDEVLKWENFSWLKIANLRTKEGWEALLDRSAHLYLINYELLPKLTEQYCKGLRGPMAFDTAIFDETTKAKNPASKRINAFRPYLHKVPRRWGLTGTPNPNSLLELFAQARLLDDGASLGKSFAQFRDTYFWKKEYEYDYKMFPGADQKIYGRIANLALVLRSIDHLDIPDTVLEDVEVPLPEEAKKVYKELEKELYALVKSKEVIALNAAVLAGKLLQVVGGAVYTKADDGSLTASTEVTEVHDAKIKALKVLGKKIAEPCLIACMYRHERERILKALPGSVSFTGCKDEPALLKQWNDGDVQYLVADPRSIGHGLNMQEGGRVIIWFSLPYSRELYDQFNARLARTGQHKVPLIYRLVSPGTIDDAVIETLKNRLEGSSALQQALVNFRKLFES